MQIPCGQNTIALDNAGGDLAFFSHAHSDHSFSYRKQPNIIASPETLDLAGIPLDPVSIEGASLLQAGHILGARMLEVESDGMKTVYTGDFSVKPNIFGFRAEIPQCDRLIMEATYGDPSYIFPPLEEIVDEIHSWIKENEGRNLIIGSYELGKAQDVIKILNECGVAPVVTEKTDDFCSVYDKYGCRLDRTVVGSEEAEEAMRHAFVAVVPMRKAKRYFARRLAEAFERTTLCAVATGWALNYRMNVDASFPLSDHSDFNDLVWFIEQTGARDVEFFCGDGSSVLAATRKAILNS